VSLCADPPYQIAAAFEGKLGETKILTAPLRLGNGRKWLARSFHELGKQLGVDAGAVDNALDAAIAAQAGSTHACVRKDARYWPP